jgi:hypothetical protein
MVVRNGIAGALRRPRPCTVQALNVIRTILLQDPFFDRRVRREELGMRTRPVRITVPDLVMLLARLMRVHMMQEPLTKEDFEEWVAVRKETLGQPFFDRERPNTEINPFSEEPWEDEGCYA